MTIITTGSGDRPPPPRGREVYHRSVTSRFTPTEWEKMAVRVPWMACDTVAMFTVEGQYCGLGEPVIDRHGYPTA